VFLRGLLFCGIKGSGTMRIVMMLFYLTLIVLGVSFSVLNAQLVDIHLYFQTYSLPISILLIIVFAVGLMWGLVFFAFRYLKLKISYTRLKDQFTLSEKEVKNLRSIPLQDQH
jgi:putative membrane protein